MGPVERLLEKTGAVIAARPLPEATYRFQFHAGFTFRDAERLAPYLGDLGVTHCYASPYLKARPGSTHGYDIIDHGSLNPEIGTPEDYEAFVAALRGRGLGQILDTVPNHMGVGTNDNAWWNDVLENGPASLFGGYFDIAWRASPRPELQDKVLLPVLGEPYGDVLEKGQLRLGFDNGAFAVQYYDRRFPLAPRSYGKVLGHRLDKLAESLGADSHALAEYQSILTAARNLPDRSETDPASVAERRREKEVLKRRLAALAAEVPAVREFIEQNLAEFNGTPGQPRSFDLLDDLLERQCYRLSYWRVAPDEINYRRFFDINDLAALSMERLDVFEAAHALVLRLLAEGKIDGLRIDHPDGLYDPDQYFRRLQAAFVLACARRLLETDPDFQGLDTKEIEGPLSERIAAELKAAEGPRRWPLARPPELSDKGAQPAAGSSAERPAGRAPLYVVAEKILGADEPLPPSWAVYGTSGYDFLNEVNGLFVDTGNAVAFNRLYRDLTGETTSFTDLAYQKKLLILGTSLASELHMLTYQLDRLAQKSRKSRDFTFNTLRRALREVIASFPVYRSYISDEGVSDTDRRYVEMAIRRASSRNPLTSRSLFRFIRSMLLLEYPDSFSEEDRAEQRRFAGKFQQVTAPVTAKGVEDTAFYVYNRLVSLNEVGGEPGHFGLSPEAVHRWNRDRQVRWPYALSPLSTHDTKRSEDVRARLNVLSEIPDEWRAAVQRWFEFNAPLRKDLDGQPTPDANEEYMLYQALVGAWPLGTPGADEQAELVKRIQAYMLKALHEAKVHTSWINPDEEYDAAVQEFVARILDEQTSRPFLDDFRAFQKRISHYGLFNSLSQTLLKIASPGVPDTYQGTELWDFSLVDPDNRRPVDYEVRRRMLGELQSAAGNNLLDLARSLVETREDGRIKLHVTYRALHVRRDHAGLFSAGEYLPLDAAGDRSAHLFAFARRAGDAWAIAVVPRLLTGLAPDVARLPLGAEVWGNTRLLLPAVDPSLRWRNVFTGEVVAAAESQGERSLRAGEMFAHFPVVLLLGERGQA
jgi:(1->4)-alpha-D-glucan 1-alpha-D-glucosylmutase